MARLATCSSIHTMGASPARTGASPAPGALRKVNSETKFAVSLLLAVSGGSDTGGTASKSAASTVTSDVLSERSSCSADTRVGTASESPNSSSQVAYVMQHMAPGIVVTSPRPTGPTATASQSKVATGTPEEQRAALQRQAALARFREKKQRRHFHKKVRYLVRKKLAESRPRYKGRFSKPPTEESADAEKKTKTAGESSKTTK